MSTLLKSDFLTEFTMTGLPDGTRIIEQDLPAGKRALYVKSPSKEAALSTMNAIGIRQYLAMVLEYLPEVIDDIDELGMAVDDALLGYYDGCLERAGPESCEEVMAERTMMRTRLGTLFKAKKRGL